MSIEAFYNTMLYIVTGLVGLCVGSFLNVVIYRVPNNMSIAFPPSHCTTCDYQLRWYDNIPVLSYIILGGKCRKCGQHISFRYTAVEIGNTLLWLFSILLFRANLIYAFAACAVSSVCLCVFFIDYEHQIIPDRFHIILICLALIMIPFDMSVSHWSHLIGAVAGFGSFWLIGIAASRHYGKEALGGGDIKLAGAMGLILGWQKFLLAAIIASVTGSILLLIIKSRNKDKTENAEFPFAPFLTAGLVIAMLFGTKIMEWYISLLVY